MLNMASRRKATPEWRQFEQLVARIEADAGPAGLKVTSPDRIRCNVTGRLREVDASVRTKVGSSDILITIECRKRRPKQDVTWIEQLATKKASIGAARTIAVSAAGFSAEAEAVARQHGIDLRRVSDVSIGNINRLMHLDFVFFPHKRCAIVRVGVRLFRSLDWTIPNPSHADIVLPPDTDPYAPIFKSRDTGATWSLNDLWRQLQDVTDPFADVPRGGAPVVRTAFFPYPGTVTIETPNGPKTIGDVLLTLSLKLALEQVNLADATKVEYDSAHGETIQRVEFASREPAMEDWRVSLQMSKQSVDLMQLRTRLDRPRGEPLK